MAKTVSMPVEEYQTDVTNAFKDGLKKGRENVLRALMEKAPQEVKDYLKDKFSELNNETKEEIQN